MTTQERAKLLDEDDQLYNNYGAQTNSLTLTLSGTVESLIEEDEELLSHTTIWNELRFVSKNSMFLVVTFCLQYTLTLFSTFFVSRLGSYELGAISLSITTFYISGPAFINGAASCLDTLCSQSYSAGNHRLMSLYIQRFAVIVMVSFIPIFAVWFSSTIWLKYLIPDPKIVELTGQFLHIVAFGAPALAIFEIGKRALQAQGIFHATFYILIIASPIHCFLNYLLLWNETFRIGFIGAPIALVISYYVMAILLLLYINFVEGKEFWTGFEPKNCFKNWGGLISMAIPGVIMIISELLAFELLTFFSSQFGVAGLASQSVVSLAASLLFQLPFSMAVCCSTRIAHYIGANYKKSAEITSRAALLCSTVAGLVNFNWIFWGRYRIASMFSEDELVKLLIVQVFPLVALIQTFDCFNVLSAGCLRGQGRQRIGSVLSFFSYYVLGTPLEYLFGFHMNHGVFGLWLGLSIGVGFLTVAEFLCVVFSDWDKIVEDSNARNSVE